MSRRAIAPGVWFDEGPQTAVTRGQSGYVARPASVVGAMVPILHVRVISDDRREKEREASARYRARHR